MKGIALLLVVFLVSCAEEDNSGYRGNLGIPSSTSTTTFKRGRGRQPSISNPDSYRERRPFNGWENEKKRTSRLEKVALRLALTKDVQSVLEERLGNAAPEKVCFESQGIVMPGALVLYDKENCSAIRSGKAEEVFGVRSVDMTQTLSSKNEYEYELVTAQGIAIGKIQTQFSRSPLEITNKETKPSTQIAELITLCSREYANNCVRLKF